MYDDVIIRSKITTAREYTSEKVSLRPDSTVPPPTMLEEEEGYSTGDDVSPAYLLVVVCGGSSHSAPAKAKLIALG